MCEVSSEETDGTGLIFNNPSNSYSVRRLYIMRHEMNKNIHNIDPSQLG